ncbi:MAG: hypothetical protein AAB364_01405 [Patescibacteria group bacterium]
MSKPNRGFIKLIITIIVAIFLLNYFHVDVRGFIERHNLGSLIAQIEHAFQAIWAMIVNFWHDITPN